MRGQALSAHDRTPSGRKEQMARKRQQEFPGTDQEAYAMVADELNDGTPGQVTMEDIDPLCAAAGERYARLQGLSWPPGTGDFDRYWERNR